MVCSLENPSLKLQNSIKNEPAYQDFREKMKSEEKNGKDWILNSAFLSIHTISEQILEFDL